MSFTSSWGHLESSVIATFLHLVDLLRLSHIIVGCDRLSDIFLNRREIYSSDAPPLLLRLSHIIVGCDRLSDTLLNRREIYSSDAPPLLLRLSHIIVGCDRLSDTFLN
ncbi:hypothetical protein, partial [Limnospira platensis]